MNRYSRLATSVLLVLVLGGGLAAAAHAVTASQAQSQLDSTRGRLGQVRDRLERARQREGELGGQVAAFDRRLDSITGQLSAIETEIGRVTTELQRAETELDRLRARLEAKTVELADAQVELRSEEAAFARRVVVSYKQGEIDYLDVLLGSRGYEDLVTRLELVRRLVGFDNEFVGRLDAARARVAAEKAAVAADEAAATKARAELERQSERLALLRAAAAAKEQTLLAAREAKAGMLRQAATSRAAWEQQEDQLLAESNQLAAIITGSGGSGAHGSGQLIWPAPGPVTSPFGWRWHPIFHVRKFHTGIDIGAGYGTPIKAADSGVVIYAGAGMTGFGNAIVIDHGRGLSTMYAHQSRLAVGSGPVQRGQVIGYVGSTGFSTGPHLHFEVRLNGNPVDPLAYLP